MDEKTLSPELAEVRKTIDSKLTELDNAKVTDDEQKNLADAYRELLNKWPETSVISSSNLQDIHSSVSDSNKNNFFNTVKPLWLRLFIQLFSDMPTLEEQIHLVRCTLFLHLTPSHILEIIFSKKAEEAINQSNQLQAEKIENNSKYLKYFEYLIADTFLTFDKFSDISETFKKCIFPIFKKVLETLDKAGQEKFILDTMQRICNPEHRNEPPFAYEIAENNYDKVCEKLCNIFHNFYQLPVFAEPKKFIEYLGKLELPGSLTVQEVCHGLKQVFEKSGSSRSHSAFFPEKPEERNFKNWKAFFEGDKYLSHLPDTSQQHARSEFKT